MKVTSASAILLTLMCVVLTAQARAESPTQVQKLGERLLQVQPFDLDDAARFLGQLYRRGVEILEDHVEVHGAFFPDKNGEQRGHLSLKVYPKGKSHSDESMKAEGSFGITTTPEEDHIHFDFKFSKEPKATFSPLDYI